VTMNVVVDTAHRIASAARSLRARKAIIGAPPG
jgi:hypothetical protein